MFTNTKKLSDGTLIPVLGLGTWHSKSGGVQNAVKDAIDVGYRLIDTAYIYNNEKEIGQAIAQKIEQKVVRRQDLYIVDKLWSTFHRSDLVEVAVQNSLEELGLDYLDLFLIHWPFALQEGRSDFPLDPSKCAFSNTDYVHTWTAMERLCDKGLVKSIGVSNFNKKQIERLLDSARIKPVVNQIECHPYLTQTKFESFLESKNIALMAYSPLGSPDRPWAKPEEKILLKEPKLSKIGERYGKTPAQVLLRYQIQRGHITIPKSGNPARLQENFEIFDFVMTDEEMKSISSLNCRLRFFKFEEAQDHKDYPFKE